MPHGACVQLKATSHDLCGCDRCLRGANRALRAGARARANWNILLKRSSSNAAASWRERKFRAWLSEPIYIYIHSWLVAEQIASFLAVEGCCVLEVELLPVHRDLRKQAYLARRLSIRLISERSSWPVTRERAARPLSTARCHRPTRTVDWSASDPARRPVRPGDKDPRTGKARIVWTHITHARHTRREASRRTDRM